MSLESFPLKKQNDEGNEGSPNTVCIDRSKYTTEQLLPNEEWSIAEEDERSKSISEIDLSKIQLVDVLTGEEKFIKGEELLQRLKDSSDIRLDLGIFRTLIDNPEFIPDEWKTDRVEDQRMPTQIFFDGSVLNGRAGRYVFGMQFLNGKWHKVIRNLENHRSGFRASAVLKM